MLAGRDTNVFMQVIGAIADAFRAFVELLQRLISSPATRAGADRRLARRHRGRDVDRLRRRGLADRPARPRRVPLLRPARLLVGLDGPAHHRGHLGRAQRPRRPAARDPRRDEEARQPVIEPTLDFLQTMPSFVYLLPIVLFFGIGASSAVVVHRPLRRAAAHPDQRARHPRGRPGDDRGDRLARARPKWQRLLRVQLPIAKRTIIVGINQTTMAALSMATIASFVNGPGLGQPVLAGLQDQRRRRRLRPGPAHRRHRDHARPDRRPPRASAATPSPAGPDCRRATPRIVLAGGAVAGARPRLRLAHLVLGRRSGPTSAGGRTSPRPPTGYRRLHGLDLERDERHQGHSSPTACSTRSSPCSPSRRGGWPSPGSPSSAWSSAGPAPWPSRSPASPASGTSGSGTTR